MLLHRAPFASAARAAAPPRHALRVQAAKKGGGGKDKKGGGPKKAGGALADLMKKREAATGGEAQLATPVQYADPEVSMLLLSICDSYWRAYKEVLMPVELKQLPEAVYKAPFVCLAHNKFEEGVSDPQFVYANRAALRLFEGTWDDIVGLPSRMSADDTVQEERNSLLQQAADSGAISNYEGWRRSLKGKRFKIRGVRLFNVKLLTGELYGQAVVFNEYEEEDGTVVTVVGEEPPPPELPPTEEELAAAAAAIEAQAAAVRALKEERGLTNKDAEVVAAVAELKARKDAAAALQRKWEEMVGGTMEDEGEEEEP
ncbi:hypothetical protein Rsub_01912 [Raphidocelis subcapitata]|uniref:MEKHLA domain-containing protein n=1 Tax=Raphidocelis subcapitata TaxID=307507 RepID=A0A2V0NWK4_9CHLO|nr:hypothetical protein Rsub_01912 [Raphidocelis subcapitata]|eukprot:GBF89195.1 hypothetical protein Rsub_01912 [Raphidocelis subcapitata]